MEKNIIYQLYHLQPTSLEKQSVIKKLSFLIENLKIKSSNLKDSGLLKEILKIKWRNSEQRKRAFIQAALKYLEFLKEEINVAESKELNYHIKNLKISLADLAFYASEFNSEIDFSFILVSPNSQPTPYQFDLLISIFYQNTIKESHDKYLIDLVVVPILRTILESKVKSILGIDIINDSKGRPIEISKLLSLISKSKVLIKHKSLELSNLKQIFEWLNHMMHRNIRPDIFVLHFVIKYLQPIFESSWLEKETRWSIFASALVPDINDYKKEIKSICEKEFEGSQIYWTEPEVYSYE